MLFSEASRPTSHPIPTGIRALDSVGLAWHPGAQHLILGRPRAGVSALLLEFAMRHLDLDTSHRVLMITQYAGSAVLQRLFRREALRLRRGVSELDGTPLLFPTARMHVAQLRIQALVESRKLHIITAPAGSGGIRFLPLSETEDHMDGAPTLVIVDGYSVARTPLDRLREMIRCSACEGQVTHSDPPLVISTGPRAKGQRDWSSLSRWETEHLLILAESTIVLQRFAGTGRALYACVGWADPDVRPETVRLEIDAAGAISTP